MLSDVELSILNESAERSWKVSGSTKRVEMSSVSDKVSWKAHLKWESQQKLGPVRVYKLKQNISWDISQ